MRFIDKTGCKNAFEKGHDKEISKMGALSSEACRIAENAGLGVMKTRQGVYRIIKKSGLGAYSDFLVSLADVDCFFRNLEAHAVTRY